MLHKCNMMMILMKKLFPVVIKKEIKIINILLKLLIDQVKKQMKIKSKIR